MIGLIIALFVRMRALNRDCSWVFFVIFSALISASGCSLIKKNSASSSGASVASSSVKTEPALAVTKSVAVIVASAEDCPKGGSTILTFDDVDANSKWNDGETILASTSICNGADGLAGLAGKDGNDGNDGLSAGLKVESAALASCPAGGLSVTTFIDSNSDGKFQDDEFITSQSTVCNGAAGKDGESALLSVAPANVTQCPAGGSVYSSSIGSALAQETVICNGLAGSDGTNGQDGINGQDGKNAFYLMGAVGPNVVDKEYTACHHDYLYLPDATNGASGWLIFRHQKNGTKDQGVGTTGFNVWSADIVDFALASEVGSITYCSFHWDPAKKILSYTVKDKTDGLAGKIGSIDIMSGVQTFN